MNRATIQYMAELSRALTERRDYFESLNAQQLRDAWDYIQEVLTMPEFPLEHFQSMTLEGLPFYSFSASINGIPSRGRVLPTRDGGVDVVIDVRYDTTRLRERQGWIEQCLGRLIVTNQLETL